MPQETTPHCPFRIALSPHFSRYTCDEIRILFKLTPSLPIFIWCPPLFRPIHHRLLRNAILSTQLYPYQIRIISGQSIFDFLRQLLRLCIRTMTWNTLMFTDAHQLHPDYYTNLELHLRRQSFLSLSASSSSPSPWNGICRTQHSSRMPKIVPMAARPESARDLSSL